MIHDDRQIEAEEVMQRGATIYQNRLRSLFEASNAGQYIAVHVDSGDFAIAKSTGSAVRALRKNHPADGRIYLRKIGDEPEYGLAARFVSGELMAERAK
jgi:hypothetical protein